MEKEMGTWESLLVCAVGTILEGWAVSKLWNWFLVPMGLNPIPTSIGVGLSCLVYLVAISRKRHVTENQEGLRAANYAYAIVRPFFVVGVGWLAHIVSGL